MATSPFFLSDDPFGFSRVAFAFLTVLIWSGLLLVLSLGIQTLGNIASKERRAARKKQDLRRLDNFDRVVVVLMSIATLVALFFNLPLVWQQWATVLDTSAGLAQCWSGVNHTVGIQLVAAIITVIVGVLFTFAAVFGFNWLIERHKNGKLLAASIVIFVFATAAAALLVVLLRSFMVAGAC